MKVEPALGPSLRSETVTSNEAKKESKPSQHARKTAGYSSLRRGIAHLGSSPSAGHSRRRPCRTLWRPRESAQSADQAQPRTISFRLRLSAHTQGARKLEI